MQSVEPYLRRGDDLFSRTITQRGLASPHLELPPLDEDLLGDLAARAETYALSEPRRGWALMRVADAAAAAQRADPFIRALAAWYLGRACNHWTQPKRAASALKRARSGFMRLDQPGWVAACDWQLNALAWTRPDLARTVADLQSALAGMERAGFEDFLPHCRLALAYARILTRDHAAAREDIRTAESVFSAQGDELNRARCRLNEASLLRREDQFERALDSLTKAAEVFLRLNSTVDAAKAEYQMALCHLLRTEDLDAAAFHFEHAAAAFASSDLELWEAMCVSNLGSVHLFNGALAQADRHYARAGKVFARHEVRGLWADALHDSAEVNILRGRSQLSMAQFRQAADLHESIGVKLPAAISITNLGKAFGQAGRYQDALQHLEEAARRLESLNSPLRLGFCEMYTALIWLQLGQPAKTHEYLDRAAVHFEQAGQRALLPGLFSHRAGAFFQQGRDANAIEALEMSLTLALESGLRPQAVLPRRVLGEALVRAGRYDEALEQLARARDDSAALGMLMDQAASLVAMGDCYARMSQPSEAERAFEEALGLGAAAWPEIEWRAHMGLADVAVSRAETDAALRSYRLGAASFARIRENFWQPSLAGSYLQASIGVFDRAVSFAASAGHPAQALYLLEQGKSSTLLRHLLAHDVPRGMGGSQELEDLHAEIGLLQEHLRSFAGSGLPAQVDSEFRQARARLHDKVRDYAELKVQLERRRPPSRLGALPLNGFDLETFRNRAGEALEGNWLALDYHLVDRTLVTILIGPDICEVFSTPVPHRSVMALDAFERARRNPVEPLRGDLEALGNLLLPAPLGYLLTPETYLLIAPHRRLHVVPWSALRPGFGTGPLARLCIPAVVPSMQTLSLLWKRQPSGGNPAGNGSLLVGVSDFRGRHRGLPHVEVEMKALQALPGAAGEQLAGEAATWDNLLGLASTHPNTGLSRFAWLHLASHFIPDAVSGRLSGLALWDRDVPLDQLRDLGPLARLVTISACSASASFVHEGDEHVDLPSTCLIAGANTVVGSLWPVLDEPAAAWMTAFHRYHLGGMRPARAVAEAQREAIRRRAPVNDWAGFVCIGVP